MKDTAQETTAVMTLLVEHEMLGVLLLPIEGGKKADIIPSHIAVLLFQSTSAIWRASLCSAYLFYSYPIKLMHLITRFCGNKHGSILPINNYITRMKTS